MLFIQTCQRVYFDGSGLSSPSTITVLCCLCAAENYWDDFNPEWNSVLRSLGMTAWHTTDVLRDQPGRPAKRISACLLNVLGRITTGECRIISIAVQATAHAAVRREHPTVQPLPDLCVGFCFHHLATANQDHRKNDCMELIFDRGKPFIRYLNAPWQ